MLKPFKDDLFAYNPVTETADDGARLTVGYDEMRDINGRDEIPERRVKRAYVDLSIKSRQALESVPTARGAIDVARTGPARVQPSASSSSTGAAATGVSATMMSPSAAISTASRTSPSAMAEPTTAPA